MAETINQFNVTEHHVRQFTTNVMMDIQRHGGLFRAAVTQGSYQGEGAQVVNYIGQARFKKRTTRWADTELQEQTHTQRWVAPEDQDYATLVDRLDKLRMIHDPTSPYVEAVRIGYGVAEDETIIDAFFSPALSGKNGSEHSAYDNDNDIAKADPTSMKEGLSVYKLRQARKRLKQNRVAILGARSTSGRGEQPMLACRAIDKDSLLDETQTTSSDYAAVKALVDGDINRFMGFDFLECEDLRTDPTEPTTAMLPYWVQSGMHVGDWQNLNIVITPRADKNNLPQIHASFTHGATRLHEKKVGKIQVAAT